MEINKILAVRNDRFGEFLLNIPALRALKQSYSSASLTLAVNPYVKKLAESIDSVDEVITWENRKHNFFEILKLASELKKQKFNLCVIFNPSKEFNIISYLAGIPIRVGYDRKWGFLLTHKIPDKKHLGHKHEIDYNLELASLAQAKIENKTLSLKIEKESADVLLQEVGIGVGQDLIAIHPWTSDPIKQWPVERFKELAKRLEKETGKKVIIIGGKAEADKNRGYFSDFIDFTGKTTLVQLAALLKRCKLLISGDSGPVHLASCVGVPVVAIFKNDIPGKGPLRWGPVSNGSIVVEKPNLQDITVEEVFVKVQESVGCTKNL